MKENKHMEELDKSVGDALKEGQSLVIKDGVVQIDPSHPDYEYWMEE